MKLSPEQQAALEPAPSERLSQALEHARNGWPIFPLIPGEKEPLKGSRGVKDATRDEEQIRKWWTRNPEYNIGGATTGRLVVDVDIDKGAVMPDALPLTSVFGRGENRHFVYRAEEGSAAAMVRPRAHEFGQHVDSRAGSGAYIVLPGSVHPSGQPYLGLSSNPEHTITDEELRALYDGAGKAAPAAVRGASRGLAAVEGTGAHPAAPVASRGFRTLTELLAAPPAEGGRNDWLAAVAGHLAKKYHDQQDAYQALVALAAASLPEPLSEAEVLKTRDSIWRGNADRHEETEREQSLSTGWLSGNGRVLFVRIETGPADAKVVGQAPWSNFDIECLGQATGADKATTYWVRIRRDDGLEVDSTVEGTTLGDPRALKKWLAGFRCQWVTVRSEAPAVPAEVRIQRYLDAQNAPTVRLVDSLGWHDDVPGFVTFDGVIDATGYRTRDTAGVIADERLQAANLAPFHHGFDHTPMAAREALAEVLTFQDEETSSVFGAWWAATLLKPQIVRQTSMFPLMAIEAPSESGKTRGMFALLSQLAGRSANAGTTTRAAFRDALGATKSGIVWADDLDDIENLGEVLRAATGEGTMMLKDAARTGNKVVPVTAAVLLSGEALNLSAQKALSDRSVILRPESPVGRRSKHDPDRPQWDDVLALTDRFGEAGLSVLAGWLQQAALRLAPEAIGALRDEPSVGHGRHRDKLRVLLAGARLLDALVGHRGAWDTDGAEHYRRVLAWASSAGAAGLQHDNTVTQRVIPWALRVMPSENQPRRMVGGRFDGLATPVYTVHHGDPSLEAEGGVEVWVNISGLADAWARDRGHHNIEQRTESADALAQQFERVAMPGTSKAPRVEGLRPRYRRLSPEYALLVLDRL